MMKLLLTKLGFVLLVAALSPLHAAENSRQNLVYSAFKPSKQRFIDLMRNHSIFNARLKKAYMDPFATQDDALIYALAMDYVHEDSSEKTRQAYEFAASSDKVFAGRRSYLEYADFALRTKRYDIIIDHLEPSSCYQFKPQCSYYVLAAKYLKDRTCDETVYKSAHKFTRMRKYTKMMCGHLDKKRP